MSMFAGPQALSSKILQCNCARETLPQTISTPDRTHAAC